MANLLKDIAIKARVTTGTVSRALSGKSGVSEGKRKEILKLAEEMHYVPNTQASNLRTGKREGLVIVSPVFGYNSIGSLRNQLLYKKASQAFPGTTMLMKDPSIPTCDFLRNTLSQNYRHIILNALPLDEASTKLLRDSKAHAVIMDGFAKGIDSVRIFRENGVFQAVRLLLLSGRKNLYFLLDATMENPTDRLRGAMKAFDSLKIPRSEIRLVPLRNSSHEDVFDAGFDAAAELLNTKPVDALFCSNDEAAIGAIAAIRQKKLRVPEDIIVTGFDNIPESKYMSPPLTTVGQPLEEIVAEVIRLCTEDEAEQKRKTADIIFPTHLIVRDSAPVTNPEIRNEVFRELDPRDFKI